MMKKFILIFSIFIAASAMVLDAADDMKRLLQNADERYKSVFLDQPVNIRLDMLDYYEAGSPTFTNDDIYRSQIRIDTISDRYVRIGSNTALYTDFYLLTPGNDSIMVTVSGLPVGAGEESITITDLRTGKDINFPHPRYYDWVAQKTNANDIPALTAAIPFITSTATVDTQTNTITLENSSITVPGIDEDIVKMFLPSKTYMWDGKKFVLKKTNK